MAIILTSRIPFTPNHPYRPKRPATSKIIFLSMEGCITEEEYFEWISKIFSEIESKIQFISVAEDAVHTREKNRTPQQKRMLGKSKPKQLLEKIEQFKIEQNDKYQFDKYPEDEFWIVSDIDANLEPDFINDFNDTLNTCDEKGYGYGLSNPFFELWLLLHHDDVTEEDKKYAVTDEHKYEKTSHFRERLRALEVPLKDTKHIREKDYTQEKVFQAVKRAKELDIDNQEPYPKYLATTVYKLIDKMIEMLPQDTIEE